MIKHEDGGITLTKVEFGDLNNAYQMLSDILDGLPSSLQDYCRSVDDYANIREWECLLNGEEFNRSDWIEDDEDQDGEEFNRSDWIEDDEDQDS